MYAREAGNAGVVKVLLDAGADEDANIRVGAVYRAPISGWIKRIPLSGWDWIVTS